MKSWNKGRRSYSYETIFCERSDISQHLLRKYYCEKKEIKYECSICSKTEWLGQKLTLELDHKNGDNHNNKLDNLRWLCPNCHSLTSTFRGNNNNGKRKIEDDVIVKTIKNSFSVREVLLKIGLRARGGNYNRIYRLMAKNNLSLIQKNKENFCIDCQQKINRQAKRCAKCNSLNKRKVKNRPSKEQLLKEIEETNYCAVGRKYGVSDNAVRKWLK